MRGARWFSVTKRQIIHNIKQLIALLANTSSYFLFSVKLTVNMNNTSPELNWAYLLHVTKILQLRPQLLHPGALVASAIFGKSTEPHSFIILRECDFTDLRLGGGSLLFFLIRACHITSLSCTRLCVRKLKFNILEDVCPLFPWGLAIRCVLDPAVCGRQIKKMEHCEESPSSDAAWYPIETDGSIIHIHSSHGVNVKTPLQVWKHGCDTCLYWTALYSCFVVQFHGL